MAPNFHTEETINTVRGAAMKWLAIMNRHSGRYSPERFRHLSDTIHRRLGADIAWTQRRKHALKLVKEHKDYDGFIAVGGDGTISDIVNGLSREEQCLGVIPFGTGNAFAHDLGRIDEAAALRALSRPRFDRLDVISVRYLARRKWHERMLITTSGIGYLAGATAIAELPFKRWGSWWYVVAAILQSFRQREFVARLRVDDGPWRQLALTTFMVHNSQYVGQFRLFPEASLTDGRLNLLYGRLRPARQLFEDLGILTQTYSFPNSTRLAPRQVDLVLTDPQTLMLDGYLVPGVERIHYQVVPGGLRCCTG
ncbi:MAG TPA: diacylglycerol kinase family protein [Gemmataceae bacterium]|nr:diacylglycerol kinase family protein [Gemmataceae bacterium]